MGTAEVPSRQPEDAEVAPTRRFVVIVGDHGDRTTADLAEPLGQDLWP
jgi:hypothetical protein